MKKNIFIMFIVVMLIFVMGCETTKDISIGYETPGFIFPSWDSTMDEVIEFEMQYAGQNNAQVEVRENNYVIFSQDVKQGETAVNYISIYWFYENELKMIETAFSFLSRNDFEEDAIDYLNAYLHAFGAIEEEPEIVNIKGGTESTIIWNNYLVQLISTVYNEVLFFRTFIFFRPDETNQFVDVSDEEMDSFIFKNNEYYELLRFSDDEIMNYSIKKTLDDFDFFSNLNKK